jgi:hypothetical protein
MLLISIPVPRSDDSLIRAGITTNVAAGEVPGSDLITQRNDYCATAILLYSINEETTSLQKRHNIPALRLPCTQIRTAAMPYSTARCFSNMARVDTRHHRLQDHFGG